MPADKRTRPKRKDVGVWGKIQIAPGEERRVRITLTESYFGTEIRIPVYVWRGLEPGPTVFCSGAIHGDEINGTGAINSLIVDRPFELKAGTLLLVPVVNVLGFERHERYLPDRRDLNRCFPGSSRGSLASRMARSFMSEIVERSDYGMDFHTAAIRRTNFPNVRADMRDERLAAFARAFGAELLVNAPGPAGSLRNAAIRAGCPTLILEAGEVWKSEPTVQEYSLRGMSNCLKFLGMVEGKPGEPPFRMEADATRWVRAQYGGFLRFHISPGDIVAKGDLLATNMSLTGRSINVVKAPQSGIVLGMTTLPSVAPGDPICHLAFVRDGALDTVGRAVEQLEGDHLHERMRDDLTRNIDLRRDEESLD